MHEMSNSYSFSDDSANQSEKNKSSTPSNFYNQKSLFPIDETDEFHDPFSDLNLFLSQKIQKTVKKHGSATNWSSKIQNELVKSLLPEFKTKFPNYRLGINALKKVWDKVSYYYGKISIEKEAFTSKGQLNIPYMIKQNLQDYQSNYKDHTLQNRSSALKLAMKLSECIASIEGKKPRVDYLTKLIWNTEKHLMSNLPMKEARPIFEEYDNVDKIIVKLLLEKTSEKPYTFDDLKISVKRSLHHLKSYVTATRSKEIYAHIASTLASKLFEKSAINNTLDAQSLAAVESFILFQFELLSKTENQSMVETIQRILALYPLICNLPENLPEEYVQAAIKHFVSIKSEPQTTYTSVRSPLALFLTTEIHFLERKGICKNRDDFEKQILKTFSFFNKLPKLSEDLLGELEILSWKLYHDLHPHLKINKLIEHEVSIVLLDASCYSFQNMAHMVLHYFQKAKESLKNFPINPKSTSEEEIDLKIDLWCSQNDMLCRYLHFDPNHKFLKLIKENYSEKTMTTHENFIELVAKKYKGESLNPSDKSLLNRLWIFYKFFWYHDLTKPEENTVTRFLAWHTKTDDMSKKKKGDKKTQLLSISKNLLPSTPIHEELEKVL